GFVSLRIVNTAFANNAPFPIPTESKIVVSTLNSNVAFLIFAESSFVVMTDMVFTEFESILVLSLESVIFTFFGGGGFVVSAKSNPNECHKNFESQVVLSI